MRVFVNLFHTFKERINMKVAIMSTLEEKEAAISMRQKYFKKLGYIEMSFNNPDGEPTHPDDRGMGKYL